MVICKDCKFCDLAPIHSYDSLCSYAGDKVNPVTGVVEGDLCYIKNNDCNCQDFQEKDNAS